MAFAQQVQSLSALWTLMYFSAIYKATSKGIFLWVSTISCKGEWQNCLSIQFWSRVCVYRLNFRQKKQNRRQISIIWAREGGTRWSLQTWSYIWSFSERKLSILSTGFHRQQKCLFSNTKKYVYMIITPFSLLLSPQIKQSSCSCLCPWLWISLQGSFSMEIQHLVVPYQDQHFQWPFTMPDRFEPWPSPLLSEGTAGPSERHQWLWIIQLGKFLIIPFFNIPSLPRRN